MSSSVLVRRSLAIVIAVSVAAVGGCGRRRVAQVPAQQTQQISAGNAYASPQAAPVLALGTDLHCQLGSALLQVLGNGQLYVDREFVGTITPDGGFYNVDGVEIGRLHENGRMTYAGTLQDAGIDGNQVTSPAGVVAYVDGNGHLTVPGSGAPPTPVIGISGATVKTFLFAFSMFAALLDTAQRMGY
ncbi:MAG: hypothetical protein M3Y87_09750 [Myxococcota bacterium]|nr:hypothetical protein [Myxococcota bacterium]